MKTIEHAFKSAVDNIARHGDTDVFPYPVENHVFFDRRDDVVGVLMGMHKDLNKAIEDAPPVVEGLLTSVGYTGFRWVTQIDPIWNAYFLGLVLSIGQAIEDARDPRSKGRVFSYRFAWDEVEKTVFAQNSGWVQFQMASVERARSAKYVLSCDIADFYPRIYHHRIENALHRATSKADECWRIMTLLMQFSKNVSYGLPVGGPAARLLSELSLNSVDRLLTAHGIEFCRFADDYHIFADSAEDAYNHLLYLSEKLIVNEGLLLQKAKTRIMKSEEFLTTSEFASENEVEDDAERKTRDFLRLRIHYDPYSQTADEDYHAIRAEIARFDILGMLGREMRKSQVHLSLAKKLVGAVRHLENAEKDAAALSLAENLKVLYPLYPTVSHVLKSVIPELTPSVRATVLGTLRELLDRDAYILQVPTHLAYTARLLALDPSPETDETLNSVFRKSKSPVVRRDVILAMAHRDSDYWLSDTRKSFGTSPEWERTALLVASYKLGDEGKHWRKSVKNQLTPMQEVVLSWMGKRAESGQREVPL